MISKHQYEQFCQSLFYLACHVGLNAAARQLQIPEERARKIASRRKWNMAQLSPAFRGYRANKEAEQSRTVTSAREIVTKSLQVMEDRSRLAMARTSMRAFEYCDELKEKDLIERDTAIALQNHGKNAQMAHQWWPNAQGVNVGVQVNVPLPTAEERAELTAIDRKLDAIAAKLKSAANRPQLEA